MRLQGLGKTIAALFVFLTGISLSVAKTIAPTPQSEKDCIVLFVDPAQTMANVPLNHAVTVSYQSPHPNSCGTPQIIDKKTKKTVPNTLLQLSYERREPGLFLNEYRLLFNETPLKPDSSYQVTLSGTVLTEFRTSVVDTVFEGRYNGQQSPSITFHPWHSFSQTIPAGSIAKPLQLLVKTLVKTNNPKVIERVTHLMQKDLPTFAEETARYDVGLARVNYISSTPLGQKKDLSTLVAYPTSKKVDYAQTPIIIYFHSWNQSKHAPSNGNTTDIWLAALAASQGFIFIAPDTLGYGATQGDQPANFLLENTGEQAWNALSATKSFFIDRLASNLTGKIILMGSRRGAYNAAATWIVLSEHNIPVSKVVLCDGRYDLLNLLRNTATPSFYDDYQRQIIRKTYAYYTGDNRIATDDAKTSSTYLYALSEANSVAPHSPFLSKQKTTVLFYQSADSKENLSSLLLPLLKNSSESNVKRASCAGHGLSQLIRVNVLSPSTACSYKAWNDLLNDQ